MGEGGREDDTGVGGEVWGEGPERACCHVSHI